jgi:signal transduction histidine kinase
MVPHSLNVAYSDGIFWRAAARRFWGDCIPLQQVLLNPVLNAAVGMSPADEGAGELVISTEQHQEGALVAVCDSGPGIDPAHLDRVFDAFASMGLAICRSIIHAHGGKLWAEANDPRGAVFTRRRRTASRWFESVSRSLARGYR